MNALPAPPNVTNFTPPQGNFQEAIELLHEAEIAGGDFRFPALGLAGPLLTEVGNVFPQNFILIYLVTSYKKRQVWNAFLAKMYGGIANPQQIIDPSAVRKKLMHTSSKELLQEAYGTVPDGFISALGRLGLEGQQPLVYLQLHEQMSKSATLRKAYSHAASIESSTVSALAALPELLKSFELAKQFQKPEDIKKLVFAIDILAQNKVPKYEKICTDVVTASKRGHSVAAVLKRDYYKLPFPDPIIQNSDQCRHINSAHKMMVCAKRFNNCLKQYVFEALRNELQVYEFLVDSSPVAVISIKHDQPLGWRIYEVKTKGNGFPALDLMEAIEGLFERYNVFAMSSMEALLRELGYIGVLNSDRQRDPVDDINLYIDELLADDPI